MEQSYGAIVKSNNSYLLVLHKKGHWDFPKGHPLVNELPEDTAIREVFEETGYHISIEGNLREIINYLLPDGKKKQVTLFLGKLRSFDEDLIIDPDEIEQSGWYDFDGALSILTYEDSRNVLRRVEDSLGSNTLNDRGRGKPQP